MNDHKICILYVDDEAKLWEIGKVFVERLGQISVDTAISVRFLLSALEKHVGI